MAMRIRCAQCSMKISIDEAFAGGVCRCPYCKSLLQVPGKPTDSPRHGRPATPSPGQAPTVRPAAPPRRTEAAAGSGTISADQAASGTGLPRPLGPGLSRPNQPIARPAAPPALAATPQMASPGAPARPAAPPAGQAAQVPTARPVKMQGVMMVILIGLAAAILLGSVILMIKSCN